MVDKITELKIKEAANIVDVVGEFVELHKSGVNFEGLCPFHSDRTYGSFIVSPTKNICNCFACNTGALDPIGFLMKTGMKYGDALLWLAGRYGIECEGADKFSGIKYQKRTPPPPKELLEIKKDWVTATIKKTCDENTLFKWIRSLNWSDEQKARIKQVQQLYLVGHWPAEGHTMFWQVDMNLKVRTGKMMKYKPDGHRDKEGFRNFDWIHSYLGRKGYYDKDKYDYTTCFFGSHLISAFPKANINIVESEKTALICAICYGDMEKNLWIASGGKEFLKPWKMTDIMKAKRNVVLFPDKDGVAEWTKLAKEINYEQIVINTEFMDRYWQPLDGAKADIADVIVRLIEEGREKTLEEWIEETPALGTLINRLNLVRA